MAERNALARYATMAPVSTGGPPANALLEAAPSPQPNALLSQFVRAPRPVTLYDWPGYRKTSGIAAGPQSAREEEDFANDARRVNLLAEISGLAPVYEAGQAISRGDLDNGIGGAMLAALPFGVRAPARRARLLMDEASRMARARRMGYSEVPFFRGDEGVAAEYHGGFFSRDRGTAAGHAARYQGIPDAQPREFRLNLQQNYTMNTPLPPETANFMATIVEDTHPQLAAAIREDAAAGLSAGHIYHMIDRSGVGVEDVLRRAGFNSVDTGSDVRMLSGRGIRSADAAFDPRKKASRNIYYGMAPLGTAFVPFAAPSDND